MDYLNLFSPQNLALLSDWLQETGELYVDVYKPHSGGGSSAYFIHSMDNLKSLIAEQDWNELAVTVFRKLQYPLRGVADELLLQKALEQIPDGQPYAFVSLEGSQYPSFVAMWGYCKSHEEFRREFAEVLGEEIGIGQDPFDTRMDADWYRAHINEVFTVGMGRYSNYAILKNQDDYLPFRENPEKYQWLVELWQQ